MHTKIFLEQYRSKKSVNTSEGLDLSLAGRHKLFSEEDLYEKVSAYDQYVKERSGSTKVRLTFQVETICTNVLFNKITEIVKDEGSSDISIVNYGVGDGTIPNIVMGKDSSMTFWKGDSYPIEAIRDTQITKPEIGYIYHCGLDIFNNHILRNNAFRAVCQSAEPLANPNDFNTIKDLMRNSIGTKVTDVPILPVSAGIGSSSEEEHDVHLYKYEDIYTFNDCVEERLKQGYDGWLGFENRTNIKTYSGETNSDVDMGIEKVLAYVNGGDFVDMYPSRDLYSFVPKYNKFQNRAEKNWNYCLTYPSSSTTEMFDDIIEVTDNLNSLKALYFDENVYGDDGSPILVIFSKAKHGLNVGDYVNIYKTNGNDNTLVLENAEVTVVQNEYNFGVFPQATKLSNDWYDLADAGTGVTSVTYDNKTFILDSSGEFYTNSSDTDDTRNYYILYDSYVNFGADTGYISYKKVSNGVPCDYYVRIFSRLPNFKYAKGKITNENDLYSSGSSLIEECQTLDNDFENHLSRLAFARTIYSDEIAQIVYTDDIDLSYLKDNRGRPITSIYLTVVKNNKGYKEWYDGDPSEIRDNIKNIEYSHCFGPVSCAFDLSEECLLEDIPSIKTINNIKGLVGIHCALINQDRDTGLTEEYVEFESDVNYYGDLVCYDYFNATETTIQYVMHRFNTAQRESIGMVNGGYFSDFKFDEIKGDDYDGVSGFMVELKSWVNHEKHESPNNHKEGYYYQPHYEIPIRSFGDVQTVMPDMLTIRSMVSLRDGLRITTIERHFLTVGDKAVIYDTVSKKQYYCVVNSSKENKDRTFVCDVYDENGDKINYGPPSDLTQIKLFKIDNLEAPSYAHMMKDGTCRYIWRNVYQNGLNPDIAEAEEYPFTNGSLYVNNKIRIYVKRQDPEGLYGLYAEDDILGNLSDYDTEDNYYEPKEIKC